MSFLSLISSQTFYLAFAFIRSVCVHLCQIIQTEFSVKRTYINLKYWSSLLPEFASEFNFNFLRITFCFRKKQNQRHEYFWSRFHILAFIVISFRCGIEWDNTNHQNGNNIIIFSDKQPNKLHRRLNIKSWFMKETSSVKLRLLAFYRHGLGQCTFLCLM